MTIGTRVIVHGRSGVVVTIEGVAPADGYIVVKFDDKANSETYLGEMVKVEECKDVMSHQA